MLGFLVCGYLGEKVGWHYGFGLAGIGMTLGMIVYYLGMPYLSHVGNFIGEDGSDEDKAAMNKPLTDVEKDRVKVLLISFLIVIVFWGAFEQAGGLLNIYTQEKTNRILDFTLPLIGNEVPASWFQSLNALFIILFGTSVAAYWARKKLKGKEASSLFKMAIGTIIMGAGFLFMTAAVAQFEAEGSSAMYWLVLAYFFHTIGELSMSPVALSFITKLAPLKYASIMMGVYFAMTGLGNKVAGLLGEASEGLGEYAIFTGIAVFTMIFGLLLVALLKPLKRLTHGAEDDEHL